MTAHLAKPTVALIDYGAGNLHSVLHALRAVLPETDGTIVLTQRPEDIWAASHIILPGVGAFADCMAGLQRLPGMVTALHEAVRGKGRPFLGICVGMQLLARHGYEHGTHDGLGWLNAEVERLQVTDASLKIPHMGWNELRLIGQHPLLNGISSGDHVYFLNSYHMRCREEADVLATSDHGGPFAAVVARDSVVGTQFHPEKSQRVGLKLLSNFLAWRP